MKRWTLRIILCLTLGAITTVAVAWGLVFWPVSPPPLIQQDTGNNDGTFLVWSRGFEFWGHHTISIFPGRIHISFFPGMNALTRLRHMGAERYESKLPSWSRFRQPSSIEALYREVSTPGTPFLHYDECAAGWPWLALRSRFLDLSFMDEDDNSITRVFDSTDLLGAPVEIGGENPKMLPLRPIWPGFLIDTLLYAAIWFGVFFGFTSAKRFIRIRRGRCPRCGYDLRANLGAGCSECGWNREEIAA